MVGAERLARPRLPESESGDRSTTLRSGTIGRDGRSRAGNLLDVNEPLCWLSYVPRWLPRMDSHHQHPASEAGVLLIELQGNKMVEPRGVAPRTSTMRAWRSSA